MKLNKKYQIKKPSLKLTKAEIEQISKEAKENPTPMPDDVKARFMAMLAEVREINKLYAIIEKQNTPEQMQQFLRLGFFCSGGKGRVTKSKLESYDVRKAVVVLVLAKVRERKNQTSLDA